MQEIESILLTNNTLREKHMGHVDALAGTPARMLTRKQPHRRTNLLPNRRLLPKVSKPDDTRAGLSTPPGQHRHPEHKDAQPSTSKSIYSSRIFSTLKPGSAKGLSTALR
ncbi:hypothetical protein T265_04902 [Opisthorchis viverrini]|uniref:Uncharacterized protein n=1 Tax=Opisthorchis viverrini TaxID=6198 RepID=A0A074ZY51_OPIVI|nr:hypothetical protein T265_04902 [Opisthorchis viverrini]KER28225.1 hypothetical protein T265_04902 [Opisthorchis viverrini]